MENNFNKYLSISDSTKVRDINKKRDDYLSWTEYFMATAFLAAKRSKDPCSQVGACIVNEDKKIVGIGYNGMPIGCNDDLFPWNKEESSKLETKYLYEVVYMSDKHAQKVETIAAKRMFDSVGIKYWQYVPRNPQVVIDFNEIDWNNMTQLPPSPKNSD
ncbi:Deoxycytidylate deaminase [Blattella germanica]|nr:Deoxycytidylate deaminase [Blattella germanica]